MKSAALGTDISDPEVTNVSQHGLWLLLDDEELFLAFEQFPWFKDTTIGKLLQVERPSPQHLYWPQLDVDLSLESIRFPERFPLLARTAT